MRRSQAKVIVALLLVVACGKELPKHEIVEPEGGYVRIPFARLADGEVHFFTFLHRGAPVNFLVRTDRKGARQAHLDACYGCFQYKMGYVVEGHALVCRACRLEYPIGDEVWDFIGACAPITLRSRIAGGHLLIETALLEKAARYF